MDRKSFIKTCGLACVSGVGAFAALPGCTGTKMLSGKISGDELVVPVSDFQAKSNEGIYYKKYIVLQNDILQFPICVYRFSENDYSALWMQCTHQGTELQVFGDKLQCPAHGSEFSNRGAVQNGPADMKLRSFPITVSNNEIRISLKAI
jgi:Rieske Fe-S protein